CRVRHARSGLSLIDCGPGGGAVVCTAGAPLRGVGGGIDPPGHGCADHRRLPHRRGTATQTGLEHTGGSPRETPNATSVHGQGEKMSEGTGDAEVAVAVEGLSKAYGGRTVVDEVSFTVHKGE